MGDRRIRIVVAKPGLDGHDRGAKVIARAFRDAGMEVIYLGLRQTPEQIVEAAVREGADGIGLSVLSGVHEHYFKAVIDLLARRGASDILVFGGGVIPESDVPILMHMGAGSIFGPGTSTAECVRWLKEAVAKKRIKKEEKNSMKPILVDHIGIAVKNIDEALKFWEGALGIRCHGVEEVEEQKVKTAFLPIRDTEIELLEGTSPDSPVAKFVEAKGEGIHHIALRVDDLEAALVELEAKGVRLIDKTPRCGAGGAKIAFVHPKASGGVLLELSQR
jgi:methylmalonyl-CoA mutase C-terminal domain/subunit